MKKHIYVYILCIIIKMDLPVKGLQNLGNTCYMNSVLQAMLSSNVLFESIGSFNEKDKQSVMLDAYVKLIGDIIESRSDRYTPHHFKRILDAENSYFRGYSQHDSQELISYIFNDFIDNSDKNIVNIITDKCFGKYKQYVLCMNCNKIIENTFAFLDIIVPIPLDRDDMTLNDCFQLYVKHEKLVDDNKYHCNHCNKKVEAIKKIELEKIPDLVIITLNRFTKNHKLNDKVKLFEYINLDGKKLKLIATVNHSGSFGGGHYIAKVVRNDNWYIANDSSISQTSVNNVINDPSVYIAFYEKIE